MGVTFTNPIPASRMFNPPASYEDFNMECVFDLLGEIKSETTLFYRYRNTVIEDLPCGLYIVFDNDGRIISDKQHSDAICYDLLVLASNLKFPLDELTKKLSDLNLRAMKVK